MKLAALLAIAISMPLRQTPGSHIQITHCNVHTHPPNVRHPWVDVYGVTHPVTDFPADQAFLAIAYTNTATKAAREIDFGLVSRGELIAIAHDRDFERDGLVAHEFVILRMFHPRELPNRFNADLPYCAVLKVTYSDGSSWRNPNPPF